MAWENHFQVLLHLMQRALFNTNCLGGKEAIFNLFSIPKKICFSLSIFWWTSQSTSDHGQRVLVCLRCRCQSWCRTNVSTELVTSHEYFRDRWKARRENVSRMKLNPCMHVYMYVPCALDGKWQINVNSCPAEQKQTMQWAWEQPLETASGARRLAWEHKEWKTLWKVAQFCATSSPVCVHRLTATAVTWHLVVLNMHHAPCRSAIMWDTGYTIHRWQNQVKRYRIKLFLLSLHTESILIASYYVWTTDVTWTILTMSLLPF